MKRITLLAGCVACTCVVHAREILWTGPSGGNWTEEMFSGKKTTPLVPILNDNTWKTFFPALGVRVFRISDDHKKQ